MVMSGPPRTGAPIQQAYKPDSVVDSHPSRPRVSARLEPPTRDSAGRVIVPVWRCTGWGLPSRHVTVPLVRSYRTFSPLPAAEAASAVSFLLHSPSGFPAWELPSTLPSGVRTFLMARAMQLPSLLCEHTARADQARATSTGAPSASAVARASSSSRRRCSRAIQSFKANDPTVTRSRMSHSGQRRCATLRPSASAQIRSTWRSFDSHARHRMSGIMWVSSSAGVSGT